MKEQRDQELNQDQGKGWTSLVVQWLRVLLAPQRTRV